jgi:response regulator RpfG family c-di-GMP phosphodiesterase
MTPPTKHCLLVVEPDVCDSVYDLLRREFRVLKARSAAEGARLVQENEVHIIMTDQRMPQVTGVELLTKLRTGHPQAVRMLFTGFADLDAIIAAINQGHIFRFIKKPWQPEELESAVREAAAEYERLVSQAEEIHKLRAELGSLHDRVTALEIEVQRLGGPPAERHQTK